MRASLPLNYPTLGLHAGFMGIIHSISGVKGTIFKETMTCCPSITVGCLPLDGLDLRHIQSGGLIYQIIHTQSKSEHSDRVWESSNFTLLSDLSPIVNIHIPQFGRPHFTMLQRILNNDWISHTPTVCEGILDHRFVYFDCVYVSSPHFSDKLRELDLSGAQLVSPTQWENYPVSSQHPCYWFQKCGLE